MPKQTEGGRAGTQRRHDVPLPSVHLVRMALHGQPIVQCTLNIELMMKVHGLRRGPQLRDRSQQAGIPRTVYVRSHSAPDSRQISTKDSRHEGTSRFERANLSDLAASHCVGPTGLVCQFATRAGPRTNTDHPILLKPMRGHVSDLKGELHRVTIAAVFAGREKGSHDSCRSC